MSTDFNILVVDDMIWNLRLITAMLEGSGYKVAMANDGESALRKVKANNIDLILLDIMMPEMDGFEVCDRLKKDKQTAGIPIIFLTALGDKKNIVKGLEAGAVDYLIKPVNKPELLARVKTHLELKRSNELLEKELDENIKIQRELHKSEHKYRQLVESAQEGIWMLNNENKTRYTNPKMSELLGYTQQELAGTSLLDYVPAEEKSFYTNYIEAAKSGLKQSYDIKLLHRDGTLIYTSINFATIQDDKTDSAGLLALVSDITQRKKAEESIKLNLHNQSFLTEVSQHFLHASDFEETMTSILAMIGLQVGISCITIYEDDKNGELCRQTYRWLHHQSDTSHFCKSYNYDKDLPGFKAALKQKGMLVLPNKHQEQTSTFEDKLLNGAFSCFLAFPLFVSHAYHGFIAFAHTEPGCQQASVQISLLKTLSFILSNAYEKMLAHLKLKASEEKFRILVERSPVGIVLTDEQGKVIEWNQSVVDITGIERTKALKQNIWDLQYNLLNKEAQSEDYRAYIEKTTKDLLSKGTSDEISQDNSTEHKITKHGKTRFIESLVFPIATEKGFMLGGILNDISLRKQTERRIVKATIDAEDKERTRIAKDLHDGLGALLSSINIYMNLARSGELEEEEKDKMIAQAKHLMDDAIVQTKEISHNLRPHVLSNFGLVKSVWSFCETINQTGKVIIDFQSGQVSEIDSDIEIIIFRVISELINNTLKHAQAEHIHLKIDQNQNTFFLDYTDDGKGFDVEKILNNRSHQGMGLGNIVSRINSLQGDCNIKSNTGEGINVAIRLNLDK